MVKYIRWIEGEAGTRQFLTYLYFVSCFKDEMLRYCNGNNPVKRENMMIHRKDGRIAVNHILFVVRSRLFLRAIPSLPKVAVLIESFAFLTRVAKKGS